MTTETGDAAGRKIMPAVLITGTSTGFGRVTTEILAAKGWRVFATMRDLAKKGPLERALKKAGLESQVTILQLDVNDPASIEAAVAAVLAETGNTLDAVVHNAGVAVAGAHEDIPDAEIRRVMETNFFGVLALTRAVLPTFRAARRGRIVLVSSQGPSPVSRQTRSTAPRNGRWRAGPSRSPMSSTASASTSSSSARPLSDGDLAQHAPHPAEGQRISPLA